MSDPKRLDETRLGVVYGIACYSLWGLFPIYWKFLDHVDAFEILAHRMAWSMLFMVVVIAVAKRTGRVLAAFRSPRTLGTYFVAASLVSFNWGLYIWAVTHDRIVETALGYFISPLVSVLLGSILLREHLRKGQWIAVTVATIGVLYLSWGYGEVPLISLALAVSFAFYGLLKKRGSLGAAEGLTLETALMFVPACLYLIWIAPTGAFFHADFATHALLVCAGVATALPLLLFSAAARRLPLSTLGLMQYGAPTVQFLIGVLLYDEPFTKDRLVGFTFIWCALIIFTFDSVHQARKKRRETLGS